MNEFITLTLPKTFWVWTVEQRAENAVCNRKSRNRMMSFEDQLDMDVGASLEHRHYALNTLGAGGLTRTYRVVEAAKGALEASVNLRLQQLNLLVKTFCFDICLFSIVCVAVSF